MLNGKKIIVGISGSIAAYKSAVLVRLLVKNGAEVKVIMTRSAQQFISALTLSTLSKNEVISDLVNESENWNNHVELGCWADAFVVAPASANTIAKMANGFCDNALYRRLPFSTMPAFLLRLPWMKTCGFMLPLKKMLARCNRSEIKLFRSKAVSLPAD